VSDPMRRARGYVRSLTVCVKDLPIGPVPTLLNEVTRALDALLEELERQELSDGDNLPNLPIG
jgi:hypothetical protein